MFLFLDDLLMLPFNRSNNDKSEPRLPKTDTTITPSSLNPAASKRGFRVQRFVPIRTLLFSHTPHTDTVKSVQQPE